MDQRMGWAYILAAWDASKLDTSMAMVKMTGSLVPKKEGGHSGFKPSWKTASCQSVTITNATSEVPTTPPLF